MSAKHIPVLLLCTLLLLVVSCKNEDEPSEPVYATIFADPNLDHVVRATIGKLEGDLTAADVDSVTRLYAGYANIYDVTGIEYMTSLHFLEINGNHITSFAPMSALTMLDTLSLSGTVTDFTPLASLTNLRWLMFDGVSGGDFSVLASFTELRYLRLWGCGLVDCSFLSNVSSLHRLELWGNPNLGDISGVSTLSHLTHLDISDGDIQDITPIAACDSLAYLSLSSLYSLTDITPLAGLPDLDTLYLSGMLISDLAPIAGLERLVQLVLGDLEVTDLSPLASLIHLSSLHIPAQAATSLATLSTLPSLSELYVHGTSGWTQHFLNCELLASLSHLQTIYVSGVQIDNLAALGTVSTLQRLICGHGCAIPNYSDLSALTHLTYLEIQGAPNEWPILNLSPLESLDNLDTIKLANVGMAYTNLDHELDHASYVNLSSNRLESIGFIYSLPNIRTLNVRGNQITDLFYLIQIQYLGAGDYLDVRDNPLNEISRTNFIPILQTRGVTVYYDQ